MSGEIRRGDTVRVVRRAVVQREDGSWGIGGEGCPWARAIGFGWQDLAILTEGPQARRNFIDGFAGFFHEPADETVRKYYIRGDTHFNAAGHRLLFDEVRSATTGDY